MVDGETDKSGHVDFVQIPVHIESGSSNKG